MKPTSLVVAVLFTLISSAALARGGGMGPGGGCTDHGMGMGPGMGVGPGALQALGLDADQQKQVAGLRTKLDAELAPVRQKMATLRGELQALWRVAEPDRQAIFAKQAEMDTLRDNLRAAMTDFRLAVHKLLTPEQRQRAAQLSQERGKGPRGHGLGCDGNGPCAGMGPGGW